VNQQLGPPLNEMTMRQQKRMALAELTDGMALKITLWRTRIHLVDPKDFG